MSRDEGRPRGRAREERPGRERERAGGRGRARRREPIWVRPEPGSRRRALDRAAIADAALRVADEEGFDAVSMRRVAAELGVGTMSLYHYIDGRDDLLALMDDAIIAEVLVPEGELPSHWRDALAAIARRSRDAWRRHPWTLRELMEDPRLGPNGMRHVEQSIAAVSGLGLGPAEQMDLIGFVDDYVMGFVAREQEVRGDVEDWAWLEEMAGYIGARLSTGEFPHLQAFMGEGDPVETWRRIARQMHAADRFERGLARVLDGIELELRRRGA